MWAKLQVQIIFYDKKCLGILSQECGGQLVVGDLQILTSPNYPTSAEEKDNTYPSDSDCMWKNIGAPNTLNIVRNFFVV